MWGSSKPGFRVIGDKDRRPIPQLRVGISVLRIQRRAFQYRASSPPILPLVLPHQPAIARFPAQRAGRAAGGSGVGRIPVGRALERGAVRAGGRLPGSPRDGLA